MDGYRPNDTNGNRMNGQPPDLNNKMHDKEDWLLDDDIEDLSTDENQLSVDKLLYELISSPEEPTTQDLFAFSDLSRNEAVLVREHWTSIPVARRRHVVRQLVQNAEEDLDLHLGGLLRIALSDEDADVRQVAIEGLWEDTSADLIGEFMRMMRSDPSVDVRAAAANGLGTYVLAGELNEVDSAHTMRAEEALLATLHDQAVALPIRCRALESIAYSSEAGVRQLIEEAYYAPEEAMRVSSLFAMGRSADIRWRGLVRAELQNPSEVMRAQAASACGDLEARAARDDLIGLLGDRDQTVRLAAIFALGRIGGQDAMDALEALTLENDTVESEAADLALEEMAFYADSDAAPLFDESLDDLDEWDIDPLDGWYDSDERDMGEYED